MVTIGELVTTTCGMGMSISRMTMEHICITWIEIRMELAAGSSITGSRTVQKICMPAAILNNMEAMKPSLMKCLAMRIEPFRFSCAAQKAKLRLPSVAGIDRAIKISKWSSQP